MSDKRLEKLKEALDFYEYNTAPAGGHVQIYAYEHPCGEALEVASTVRDKLRKWQLDRDFQVVEEGGYEWLGVKVSYSVATGQLHEITCDHDGNPIITQDHIERIFAGVRGGRLERLLTIDSALAALRRHFGPGVAL